MPSTQLDPPDTFEKECSWCSDDPRPSAFCCKACEDASREANEEPDDVDPFTRNYERELAFLSARGAR